MATISIPFICQNYRFIVIIVYNIFKNKLFGLKILYVKIIYFRIITYSMDNTYKGHPPNNIYILL